MNLEISNLSTLNKQGLALKLAEKMADNLWTVIRTWDIARMKLIQKIAKNGGLWEKPMLELQQYHYFIERGILFPCKVDGKKVVVMPSELVLLFNDRELLKDNSLFKRNTEWIRLTVGLLYSYGTLTYDELERLVISYSEYQMASSDMIDVIYEAAHYYDEFDIDADGLISHEQVIDPDAIRQEWAMRPGLELYPFTKQQILKASEPEYAERNIHYTSLLRYVQSHYEIDREEAEFIIDDCVEAIKNGDSITDIIESIQDDIEMPSLKTVSDFTDLLVPLMNSTRQWVIKGYSPNELSAKRASGNALLNSPANRAAAAEVIDFQTRKKIGRNDPCPCGSGKKFKKCCGQ